MSASSVLFWFLLICSVIFLIIDKNILNFSFKKKQTKTINNDDFNSVKNNKALISMLNLKEANQGIKREEKTYLEKGKNILSETSFMEIQKSAIDNI